MTSDFLKWLAEREQVSPAKGKQMEQTQQKNEPRTVRGTNVKDIVIEGIDACMNECGPSATDKLVAITAALDLLLRYDLA